MLHRRWKWSIGLIVIVVLLTVWGVWFSKSTQPENERVSYEPHPAISMQASFYDSAFARAKPVSAVPEEQVAGILVSHHLLVADLIARAFTVVQTTAPRTVVLISPNHFYRGDGHLTTALGEWTTPYGTLVPDRARIQQLTDRGVLTIDDRPFTQEHGVSGEVSFLKREMPNAQIIPIIVRANAREDEFTALVKTLHDVLPADALIIGSFDFSHYLPDDVATFHDVLAQATVEGFDLDATRRLDIDSRQGLRLYLQLLQDRGAAHFTQLDGTNSARYTSNLNVTSGTSYITGYFTAGTTTPQPIVTLEAVGSIAFTPTTRLFFKHDQPVYDTLNLQRMLSGAVYMLAPTPGITTADSATRDAYGITDTITDDGVVHSRTVTVQGINISLITFTASSNLQDALSAIASEHKNARATVVGVEWGSVTGARERQVIARKIVDAGADIVIGAGDSIQPEAVYHDRPIFYALGTLLDASAKVRQSIALGISITAKRMDISAFAFSGIDDTPQALGQRDRDILLKSHSIQNVTHVGL